MKGLSKYIVIALMLLIVTLVQCVKDPQIPNDDDNVIFTVPEGWPQPVYNFEENKQSTAGFQLGRMLFYDRNLSLDGTVSCGDCHQQFAGFAHSAHARSHGINGLFGIRNAPALSNLNWHPQLMWDGGVNHLTVQPLVPLLDDKEMGNTLENILKYLNSKASYREKFKAVYGSDVVTTQNMLKALTQFLGLLVSSNSKYDKISRNESGFAFSTEEQAGKAIFMSRCASCHVPPLFSSYKYKNIGLQPNISLQDSGRARISEDNADLHAYKIPSLRNVEVSGPYMHDGRFKTLDKAIEYHINKPYSMPGVDPLIVNGSPLSTTEIQQLIAFLKTLTDTQYLGDKRFANPNIE